MAQIDTLDQMMVRTFIALAFIGCLIVYSKIKEKNDKTKNRR